MVRSDPDLVSSVPSVTAAEVARVGKNAGLDRVGVTSADSFAAVLDEMNDRSASGLSGKLRFTYKDPALATDIRLSFPWAERLVVGVRSYLPEAGQAPIRAGHGRVARFAVDDPYVPLKAGLQEMADLLVVAGFRAEVLADDDRLVDRAAAVRAGVGWWGKSTLVITPGLGPWFVVGSVVTDAPLEVDSPMMRGCGSCDACLPACPTGALVEPGVLDARRCLAAIAQTGGVVPREWRSSMGDRLYGCDDCLDACPPGVRLSIRSSDQRGSVELGWVLTAADRTLMERFSHFYLPGRSPRVLRRNALVAIGNDGDERFVPLVAAHVGHHDWLLRAHAVWALARIGGPGVRAVLEFQAQRERTPEVLDELRHELGDLAAR